MFTKPTKPDLLAEGQVLIIAARWVLIVLGLFLTLLDTRSVSFSTTRFEVMVILLLALSNFYLVSQVLVVRLMMLAAVAVCGNYFASIEQKRRSAVVQAELFTSSPKTSEPSPQY